MLSDLYFYTVSTSDIIAVLFYFALIFVAIITVFITRRGYYTSCLYIYLICRIITLTSENKKGADINYWLTARDFERPSPRSPEPGMQAQEDLVMEEM
jgi:hypothetical protein